jgi:hypothetical protein
VHVAEGPLVTDGLVRSMLEDEAERLRREGADPTTVAEALGVFVSVALGDEMLPFLTLPAYELLP